MAFVVATFYHFFDFPHFAATQRGLKAKLVELDIKGTLLLAPEGINGTLAGSRAAIDGFLALLKSDIVGGEFVYKESMTDRQPFGRAKVRLKKEIISMGVPPPVGGRLGGGRYNAQSQHISPHPGPPPNGEGVKRRTGTYVNALEWNALIDDPEVLVIDARNEYEVHLGSFPRAVDPGTRNFKELPGFVRKHIDPASHKKIATFCTGGIRCEKFSAWLLEQGFEDVYQLHGGILKYLEEVPEAESRWQGECYVFDERIAVGHQLEPSQTAGMCRPCGHTLTWEDKQQVAYVENVSCPYCI